MTRHFTQFLPGLFAFCLLVGCLSAADGWDNLNKRKGAEAAVNVTIVDDEGKPLVGIPVQGFFYHYRRGKVNKTTVTTDSDGHALLTGICDSYNVNISLEQDGYYETSEKIDMLGKDYPGDNIVGVRDGKWQPYGIQRKMTFKKKRHPIPMLVFSFNEFEAVAQDREYGYDLEYGSFVAPYGDGKVADFYLKYTWEENEKRVLITATLRFPNEKDGAYIIDLDPNAELKSPYHADPDASYDRELVFSTVWTKFPAGNRDRTEYLKTLSKKHGLILRTRSVVDSEGRLLQANYGKFYGEMIVEGHESSHIFFCGAHNGVATYFNPVVNDTNLEFDGKSASALQKGKRDPDVGLWKYR